MNQSIKLSQVIPVHNAEFDKVTASADFQFFTDPSLIVFDTFPLNDKAGSYFRGGEAVGDER
jgi:hypothetical protein